MNEVACTVLVDQLAFLERKQIPVSDWLGPAPTAETDLAHLRQRGARISWALFSELNDRYYALLEPLGANEEYMAYTFTRKGNLTAPFRSLLGVFTNVCMLYSFAQKFAGHNTFRCVLGSYEALDDGRLRLGLDIPEGYAHCDSFFQHCRMAYTILPRLLGLPDASVEAHVSLRHAEYLVTLPTKAPSLLRRLLMMLMLPFSGRKVIESLTMQERDLRSSNLRLQQSQIELERAKAELEQRVAERTRDLLAAKEQAEAANRAKTAFLANMSHELRTPLTSILGFTEILANADLDPALRRRHLDTIGRNGRHLLKIVEELLDVARIETGRLRVDIAPVDLPAEIAATVQSLESHAAAKGLTLGLAIAPAAAATVRTDAVRLRQIVMNVVSNAIKFTNAGRVDVSVDLRAKSDGEAGAHRSVLVQVADTGIGVPFDKRDSIFRPFGQADATLSRSLGGLGLGLTLSRDLARTLGGDLRLEQSEVGRGSTFVIEIDADPR